MTNIASVLNQLQQERSRLTLQIDRLNQAISALKGTSNSRTGRTLSAAGRARIVAAQRARWAKARGQKVVSINARRRRRLSVTALANIRAAQKARWAKWRKQRKTPEQVEYELFPFRIFCAAAPTICGASPRSSEELFTIANTSPCEWQLCQ